MQTSKHNARAWQFTENNWECQLQCSEPPLPRKNTTWEYSIYLRLRAVWNVPGMRCVYYHTAPRDHPSPAVA